MKNYFEEHKLIIIWLFLLSLLAVVFYPKTATTTEMKEKQSHLEEILLKQSEILAVNTTLLKALFERSNYPIEDEAAAILFVEELGNEKHTNYSAPEN